MIVLLIFHTLPFLINLRFLIIYNIDGPSGLNGRIPKREYPLTKGELIKIICMSAIPLINIIFSGIGIYEMIKQTGWLDEPVEFMLKEKKQKDNK